MFALRRRLALSAACAARFSSSQAPAPSNAAAGEREAERAQDEYHFPTQEALRAVKKGDIGAVQGLAADLISHKWHEDYSVPAACTFIFFVVWYWIAWARRSVRRKCEAAEARTRQEADQTVETVAAMVQKWKRDMDRTMTQTKGIINKNRDLASDIDRMTTALRSCSIRPTPNVQVAPKAPAAPAAEAKE